MSALVLVRWGLWRCACVGAIWTSPLIESAPTSLLSFLWWWSRVHNSYFLRWAVREIKVKSGERQVSPELLSLKVGRIAEDHIFDQLLRCGTDAVTAVSSTTADLAAGVSCTRKRGKLETSRGISTAVVWQCRLNAGAHAPHRSWRRSAAAASAAQQHGATAAGPTAAVRLA